MEFKGKRQYEIAKKVGFNRKKNQDQELHTRISNFYCKEDDEEPANKTGKNSKLR